VCHTTGGISLQLITCQHNDLLGSNRISVDNAADSSACWREQGKEKGNRAWVQTFAWVAEEEEEEKTKPILAVLKNGTPTPYLLLLFPTQPPRRRLNRPTRRHDIAPVEGMIPLGCYHQWQGHPAGFEDLRYITR
jgi:hypothetical protein